MSTSEIHAALKRSTLARLYNPNTRQPSNQALLEFLTHGIAYVFPAHPGALMRGLATSYAAPVFEGKIRFDEREQPVMPLSNGPHRGLAVPPLCKAAPKAAQRDENLYALLALIDALRTGRARERKLAIQHLERRLTETNEAA